MQDTRYTTGAWTVFKPIGEGDFAILSERVNAGGTFYVATIPNGSHAEAEANAALIAAAPELLDACRSAVKLVKTLPEAQFYGNTLRDLQTAIDKATTPNR